jgi:phenylacetate 2-hydroxylase
MLRLASLHIMTLATCSRTLRPTDDGLHIKLSRPQTGPAAKSISHSCSHSQSTTVVQILFSLGTTVVVFILWQVLRNATMGFLRSHEVRNKLVVGIPLMLTILILIYTIADYIWDISCDQRRIANLPCIPGYPIVGNLLQLGPSQAITYLEWSKTYGPVFQMRLGNKRVVVANSYNSARALWIDNMAANCSRPISYTFHQIVSSSQGCTIGTTPWSQTYQRKKRVTGPALSKPAVRSYMSIIDRESAYCIRSMVKNDLSNIDVQPYLKTYALNTSLTLNYGTRLDDMDHDLLDEIMRVEKEIGRFRGNFHNYQDYIPILRWLPSKSNKLAVDCRQRRDRYMEILLSKLREEIKNNTAPSCITGNILRSPDAIISEQELNSICLTMVSAGLDTVPAMLTYFIGHMSQPYGWRIQQKAFSIINQTYPNGDAWTRCLQDDGINYVQALVKETLRFSAMPLSLPRETIKDIRYGNAVIPAKSTLFLNAFGANFDDVHFEDPYEFRPERYMTSSSDYPHFAFGAGIRMCAGKNLAERELYTGIIKIVCAFSIHPPPDVKDMMTCDPMELFKEHNSLMDDPPKFKVRLEPRDITKLEEWLQA